MSSETNKTNSPRDWQKCLQTISLIAIPLILAFGGWFSQHYLQEAGLKRDYVQLAVEILQAPAKENTGLRKWAVALIDEYAHVKLDPEVAKHLATGDVVWPGSQTIGCLLSELKRHIEESNKQWRASILGVTFPKARSETLISLLADLSSHPDEIIRSKALSCLMAIDSPAAIEALKKYKD